jgi:hypothetical protein
MFRWGVIESHLIDELVYVEVTVDSIVYLEVEWWNYKTSISSALYSPNSNFFEVIYELVWEKYETSDYYKVWCVVSKDPLQYLIENLNETTII